MTFNKDNPLRVMTLCSGYDSQCLALERLKRNYPDFDYELVAWAEFDPESKTPLEKQPAVRAHNALFPQWADRNWGDITKIDWEKVPDMDLLFYSTPCQSISAAGLQHGFAEGSGTRSSIIWNVRDAVIAKRPKYLCLENVEAMMQKKFVGMFNLWQRELERLGYANFARVLNAQDYGVPQHRPRIFLVSIRMDGLEGIAGNVRYHWPKPFPLKERMEDRIEEDVDESFFLSDERVQGLLKSTAKEKDRGNGFAFKPKRGGDIANTIKTSNNRKTDNFMLVYDKKVICPMERVEQLRRSTTITALPTFCEGGGYGASAVAVCESDWESVEQQAERKDI